MALRTRLAPVVLFASLVVTVTLGCGPSTNTGNSARVSGSLTYKGQPIKGGTIIFYSSDGVQYQGIVSGDGTYEANDIAIGELVVAVETESANTNKRGGAENNETKKRREADAAMMRGRADSSGGGRTSGPPPVPENKYIKIPAKYGNAKTSPLTVTLKAGRQVQNLDLTD